MRSLVEGYRRLMTHPRYGIWVILGTLLYLISPIDLSPDLFPLIGQIDDVALIVLMISAIGQLVGQQFQNQGTESDAKAAPETAERTIDVNAVEVESQDS
ncbi:MAG: DUF1232 domain-containing protein [Cyanobacteria bacterium P01_H01_bin.58]